MTNNEQIIEIDNKLNDIEVDLKSDQIISFNQDGTININNNDSESFIEKIDKLTNRISSLSEYIDEIPNLMNQILLLPELYIDYFLNKLNIINLSIQKELLKLLKLKNNILINLLTLIGSGSFKETNNYPIFNTIEEIFNNIEIITSTFITAFNSLINIILGNPLMALMPESMNFGITPKSLKFVTQIPVLNPNNSITNAIMSDKVDSFIEKLNINEIDGDNTFLNENFNKLIKSTNAFKDNVLNGIRALGMTLCYTQEPLPKYENLSLSNLQFCSYILNSWGPTGKTCFGLIGYP